MLQSFPRAGLDTGQIPYAFVVWILLYYEWHWLMLNSISCAIVLQEERVAALEKKSEMQLHA